MSTLTVAVPPEDVAQRRAAAERLHISVEQLVAATIENLLAQPDEQFERTVEYVPARNAVLYRRLAH
ncbi:MAG: DNA-binding protein [Acidobacteria bacterium]|nr:DNA-binding protein [Acidobacteriota bacterium]